MRKQGFTLVEVMIVVLILGILLMIAVPNWMIARERSYEKARDATCKSIDHAKQEWIMRDGLAADAVPAEADLVPKYLDRIPKCPGGCTWDYGSGAVPCTYH